MSPKECVEAHWQEISRYDSNTIGQYLEICRDTCRVYGTPQDLWDLEVLKIAHSKLRALENKAPEPNLCDCDGECEGHSPMYSVETMVLDKVVRNSEPDFDRDVLEFELECLMKEVSNPNERCW